MIISYLVFQFAVNESSAKGVRQVIGKGGLNYWVLLQSLELEAAEPRGFSRDEIELGIGRFLALNFSLVTAFFEFETGRVL